MKPKASETPPTPKYRIRRNGRIVEVRARHSDRGWALQPEDQSFAVAVSEVIEEACTYFHVPDAQYSYHPDFQTLTDQEVEERIKKLDLGEHRRETYRSNQPRFPLQKLPIDWKRALVANLDRIALEWGFEKVEQTA